MLVEKPRSVDDWVDFLGKEHMPALAETVQKLSRLTTDDDSRVSQLTEQILKDPSLTSRVLQVSNSVVYKGYGGNIKTITRAIVMLGFTTIRDISLSMQILDNILKQNPSDYLLAQIANSFHGAMQARGLLRNAKSPEQEEIFISTLLLHFAELSMLARDDEVSRKLNMLLRDGVTPINDAAMEVLGCRFDQISIALAKQWELGDLLLEALSRPRIPSRPAQAVMLGDELSQVAILGWDAGPVKEVVKKIAKYRDVPFKDAMQEVRQMADMAQELAVQYGASKVRHLIPSSETREPLTTGDQSRPLPATAVTATAVTANTDSSGAAPAHLLTGTGKATGAGGSLPADPSPSTAQDREEGIEELIELALSGQTEQPHQPVLDRDDTETRMQTGVENMQLQMDIMQQLNKLIADKRMDVNGMLSLVLQGMTDAIGLDRVVMALVARDRKKMVPKFFSGTVAQDFRERFKIDLMEENTFAYAIRQSQNFWIGSKLMAGRAYLHTPSLQAVLQCSEYMVAPVIVARRPIGVFYGDQAVSGKPLNEQQYAGFSMLAQQAGLALTAVQN